MSGNQKDSPSDPSSLQGQHAKRAHRRGRKPTFDIPKEDLPYETRARLIMDQQGSRPIRPMSAFCLYCQGRRERLKEIYPQKSYNQIQSWMKREWEAKPPEWEPCTLRARQNYQEYKGLLKAWQKQYSDTEQNKQAPFDMSSEKKEINSQHRVATRNFSSSAEKEHSTLTSKRQRTEGRGIISTFKILPADLPDQDSPGQIQTSFINFNAPPRTPPQLDPEEADPQSSGPDLLSIYLGPTKGGVAVYLTGQMHRSHGYRIPTSGENNPSQCLSPRSPRQRNQRLPSTTLLPVQMPGESSLKKRSNSSGQVREVWPIANKQFNLRSCPSCDF